MVLLTLLMGVLAADPEVIAITGGKAPGDKTAIIDAVGDPVINQAGTVAFRALAHHTNDDGSKRFFTAVWLQENNAFQILAPRRTRGQNGKTLTTTNPIAMNAAGQIVFKQRMTNPPVGIGIRESEELWGPTPDGYAVRYRAGDRVTDEGTFAEHIGGTPVINPDGSVGVFAFAQRRKQGKPDDGWWAYAIVAAAFDGQPAPAAFASSFPQPAGTRWLTKYTSFNPDLFAAEGHWALMASDGNSSALVRREPNGAFNTVAAEGGDAPGLKTRFRQLWPLPELTPGGTIGFSAMVDPPNPGRWNTTAWLASPDSPPFAIVADPMKLPGLDAYKPMRIAAVELDAITPLSPTRAIVHGQGHFTKEPVRFGDNARRPVSFVWLCEKGRPATLIMRSGQKLTGPFEGLEVSSVMAYASPAGSIVLDVRASPDCRRLIGAGDERCGLFSWAPKDGPSLMLYEGQSIHHEGRGLTIKTINSGDVFASVADDGAMILTVTLKEGHAAIVRAR